MTLGLTRGLLTGAIIGVVLAMQPLVVNGMPKILKKKYLLFKIGVHKTKRLIIGFNVNTVGI